MMALMVISSECNAISLVVKEKLSSRVTISFQVFFYWRSIAKPFTKGSEFLIYFNNERGLFFLQSWEITIKFLKSFTNRIPVKVDDLTINMEDIWRRKIWRHIILFYNRDLLDGLLLQPGIFPFSFIRGLLYSLEDYNSYT